MAKFLPNNLPPANIYPDIIDQELLDKVTMGCMSGPFTLTQATAIFGGFFCCTPVGLVKKIQDSGNW